MIARYGVDEVRSWYFEVWNEPNLKDFWDGYLRVLQETVEQRFTPSWVPDTWRVVERIEDILPATRSPMPEPV